MGRAAHHLEIMCGPHQSENSMPGQSGDKTNGGTATSGLGRYWVQSIKGHVDSFPVLCDFVRAVPPSGLARNVDLFPVPIDA